MENKYFTPDIEDIHAGYECELLIYDKWEPNIVKPYTALESVVKCIKDKVIRVPYLTKEQIEAEGWKHSEKDCFNYNDRWMCSWYPEYNRMEFCDDENENGFAGECKDINTFRKIIKLLNIK